MKRATSSLFVTVFAVCAVAAGAACDPVHSNQVDTLGPEDPGVRAGPEHRPGQPCVVCHGGRGPAGGQQFSVGGTVYTSEEDFSPAAGVIVQLTDARGKVKQLQTNSAGNFFAFTTSWDPVYPVRVVLNPGTDTENKMRTHVGRDGSCAGCHISNAGPDSPGPVLLNPGTTSASGGGQDGGP